MKLTETESQFIRDLLPEDAAKRIAVKVRKNIGLRMVYHILNGKSEDKHGVIELAMAEANKEKARREKAKKQLNQLKK